MILAHSSIAPLRKSAPCDELPLKAETRTDEQRAAIAGLETRAAGLEARLGDESRALKLKIDALEAGRAREARAEEKRADLAAIGEKSRPEEDRALREAIVKLGDDVLRLFERQGDETASLMTKLASPQTSENIAALPPPEKKRTKAPAAAPGTYDFVGAVDRSLIFAPSRGKSDSSRRALCLNMSAFTFTRRTRNWSTKWPSTAEAKPSPSA